MGVFANLLHPDIELIVGFLFVNGVNEQDGSDALVKRPDNRLVGLLSYLWWMKIYRVPDLEFDVGLLVKLDSFSEELDACGHLIIVGKDVADVLHEEGGLADAFVI